MTAYVYNVPQDSIQLMHGCFEKIGTESNALLYKFYINHESPSDEEIDALFAIYKEALNTAKTVKPLELNHLMLMQLATSQVQEIFKIYIENCPAAKALKALEKMHHLKA